MRILQVINSTDPDGGGPIEAIVQAGSAVAKRGHEMEVVCVDPPDAPWIKTLPLKTHALGPAATAYRYSSHLAPWLRRHGREYDCAIVNGIWLYPSYAVWKAFRDLNVPYFVYTHGLLDPAHHRTFPVRRLKKMLSWIMTERRVLDEARGVFFTCDTEREAARGSFWPRQQRDNGVILPYCIDTPPGDGHSQKQLFLDKFGELGDKRRILFLSRVHPKKGLDILIQAFAQAAAADRTLHLIVAGPGEDSYIAKMRRLSESCGVGERVTWTGVLRGDLKWGAFHAADLFALPSHHENFGIAVVEALACGLPVLISDAINIAPEILADGAGLVCRDNVESTTMELERWCALNDAECLRMRNAANRCFHERFSADAACERLLEVLHRSERNEVRCPQVV